MAEELKACPFCGGKAEAVQFTRKRWTVECFADGCGAGIISHGDMQAAISTWNTRAQLPSQGGEAVAWHTEDHLTDKSATTYDPEVADRWRTKGWPVTPLYTHPADQVAELKTILTDLDGALEDLELHGRHSDQGYRKLKDWYRKVALITDSIDALLAKSDGVKK